MPGDVTAFVAYPSNPPDRAESIEEAIQWIKDGKAVDIIGWKDLRVTGRLIISSICDAITERDLFIADLTALNSNVLFELGYALVNRKRLWLLLNTNIERAKAEFDRFGLLTTAAYRHFNSSDDIHKAFYTDLPYQDLGNVLYDELLHASGPPNMPDALLYIKPAFDTDAVRRITRRVSSGPMRSVIDDPSEMVPQPLSWYAQQVDSSFAVVTHFLAEDYDGYRLHNAKHALVAGMALGLGRPLLMLAHAPYSSPLDYKDLLRVHNTARNAEAIFDNWLAPNLYSYEARIKANERKQVRQRVRGELRSIAIGDPVAENESESVTEYFVPTAAYTEALESTHSIFIGRKGAGKTATLYKLSSDLGADPRNHLCVVKPVDYEIEGILAMLRQELSRSEKGYLVESFWKFLLYTELTRSIHEEILSKPDYYGRTESDNKLVEFVSQHSTSITPEFSSRLETVVERLRGLSELAKGEARKLRISEMLHTELISKMRDLLGRVLTTKAKVVLLVDNLDKAWTKDTDIELLSELLYGLLSVSGRVAEDFRRSASGLKPVKLHFTLFLRSDIFAAMLHFAKERDKLPVRRLTWEQPETLRAVVEERFAVSSTIVDSPTEIWGRYFCATVEGVPIQDYLESIVFPRPRDLIFLVKSALHHAVNCRRDRIEESDILAATKEYSRFSFNSFLAEVSARIPEAEDLLLHFLQVPEIITNEHILRAMTNAGIPVERLNNIVELLGELTFLGFEVSPNKFEFIYDEQNTQKIFLMAEKTKSSMGQDSPRFRVHPALHSFLEVQPNRSYGTGQIVMDLAGE